jgi:hypothetical protein
MLACCFLAGCGKKPAAQDHSRAEAISITYGKEKREAGLRQAQFRNGVAEAAVIQGQECQTLNLGQQREGYLSFIVDPAFKTAGCTNATVTVDYFDGRPGAFDLQYDGPKGGHTRAGNSVVQKGTRTWQTAQFSLRQVRWQNAKTGSIDFRLHLTPPEFSIKRVVLARDRAPEEPTQFAGRDTVSIELGLDNREQGLHQVHLGRDGETAPATKAGQECRQLTCDLPGRGACIYFAIDPDFKGMERMNGKVTVEYCGAPTPGMDLQYDQDARAPYATNGPSQLIQCSESWQAADFFFHDARFNNTENSGADFRIRTFEPGVYIRRVTLTRLKELPPAEAPKARSSASK